MADLIGTRLGDFAIVRELGRGGMGVVYEARQVSLNRRVALKVLSGGIGLTGTAVQRFRREAEAAAKLHHTNIVPVYAIGEVDGVHYYAMELIEGPSLDHVIRKLRQPSQVVTVPGKPGRVSAESLRPDASPSAHLNVTGPYVASADSASESPPPLSSSSLGSGGAYFDSVARMVAAVADALGYAHKEGVIHRDIKPSNLLLSPDGRLSVNDFGLARVLEQPGMTVTGEFVGTPLYMSPEQITAGRAPLDHRTDIYSLGATLFELLTLQPPFKAERRDQVISQIIHKEPKAPRKLNKKVPVDLETICLKALEKDPDRRYQTAGTMAEDLRRYVNRFAIAARRAGPGQRLVKWARRRPALAATLALAWVLAVVAAFFAYQGHLAEQRRLVETQKQEELLTAEKRQSALERAVLMAMSGDLDAAEKAIQEAERHGVSIGHVRLLRGEMAYYRGQTNEAIEHLEQAVKLLPVEQSAGARGLLIVAYVYAMRREDAARELRELEPIQPVSTEDFLFKGTAVGQWDEEQGLAILDEAVKRRPSSAIARLFRSDPLINLAMDQADPVAADRAVEDAETAKRLLAETAPVALWYCAGTYAMAACVYKAAGLEEKYHRTLALALKDAEALEQFKHIPQAEFFRRESYWLFGQKDHALDELRLVAKQQDSTLLSYLQALILSWRGARADLQEVRRILDPARSFPPLFLLNCFAVAELEGREAALQLYRCGPEQSKEGRYQVYVASIPLLLGKPDLAREQSRADRRRQLDFRRHEQAFFHTLFDYLAGVANETDLLQAAAGSQRNASQAHYFIGMMRLAEGDRAQARAHFERVIACTYPTTYGYDFSVVFLARLDKDPAWPPWIPLKK